MNRHHHIRQNGEDGQALVEFALVLPVLLLLLIGIVDLARAYETWNEQTSVANSAARFVAVGQPVSNAGTPPNSATVTVCLPAGSTYAVGNPITVNVKSTYTFLPFFASETGTGSTTINGSATTRIEQTGSLSPGAC